MVLSDCLCFIPQSADADIRQYFEGRRGGFLGPKDDIERIEMRYAPVGVFELKWCDEVDSGFFSKIKKIKEKSNVFYINLNNAELYYVSRGFFSKRLSVQKSDVLAKIIDLPDAAVAFLSDIVKRGSIKHHELNKKHFLFLDGNFDMILMLKTRELIGYDIKYLGVREYFSRMNLLDLDDKRYNLGNFLATEKKDIEAKEVDELKHEPQLVLDVLKNFLQGDGAFTKIVYLPYHECKYVDKAGGFRYLRLIDLRFLDHSKIL